MSCASQNLDRQHEVIVVYLALFLQQLRVLNDLLQNSTPLAGLEGQGIDLCWRGFEVLAAIDPGFEAAGVGCSAGQYADRFVVEGHGDGLGEYWGVELE